MGNAHWACLYLGHLVHTDEKGAGIFYQLPGGGIQDIYLFCYYDPSDHQACKENNKKEYQITAYCRVYRELHPRLFLYYCTDSNNKLTCRNTEFPDTDIYNGDRCFTVSQ